MHSLQQNIPQHNAHAGRFLSWENIAMSYNTLGSLLSSELRPITDMYPMVINQQQQRKVKLNRSKGKILSIKYKHNCLLEVCMFSGVAV